MKSSRPATNPPAPAGGWLAGAAVLALAGAQLALLWIQSGAARLYTDECYHAQVAVWIAAHGRLPRETPEFYSGFAYFYPPLFHLLGAAWVKAAGVTGLLRLNVVLYAGLLAIVAGGPPATVPAAARRWTILVLLSIPLFAAHAVRFYVEMSSAVVAMGLAVLWLRWRAAPGPGTALGLGASIGLAMLTKQTGLVTLPGMALVAALEALRGRRATALQALGAAGVGLVLAAPYFARNAALFGSPLYPLFARDAHPRLAALQRASFSSPPLEFYRALFEAFTPVGLAVVAAGAGFLLWRRAPGAARGLGELLALGSVLWLAAPLMPVHDPRHLLPVFAILVLAGAAALQRGLAAWPRAAWGVEAVLLAVCVVGLARMPDFRAKFFDLPAPLAQAYEAIRSRTPEDARVLSLWTYDTAWHTGRAATWPVPYGQRDVPYDLLVERDPERIPALLQRYGIDAVLVPLAASDQPFDGSSYPSAFVGALERLARDGRLTVAWQSEYFALLVRPRR